MYLNQEWQCGFPKPYLPVNIVQVASLVLVFSHQVERLHQDCIVHERKANVWPLCIGRYIHPTWKNLQNHVLREESPAASHTERATVVIDAISWCGSGRKTPVGCSLPPLLEPAWQRWWLWRPRCVRVPAGLPENRHVQCTKVTCASCTASSECRQPEDLP